MTYARPFFRFALQNDRLARPYALQCTRRDPLVFLYHAVAQRSADYQKMLGRYSEQKVIRNDGNAELILVKEVHSLLAVPSLVDALQVPAVVITRDPVYVIDSLLAYQNLSVILWRNEYQFVKDPNFLAAHCGALAPAVREALLRYPDDGTNRRNTIAGKALTVALIARALKRAADRSPQILHVYYADLCEDPMSSFERCGEHFGLDLGRSGRDFVVETLKPRTGDDHPTRTVHKDTRIQATRSFKSLTGDEVEFLYTLLENLNLTSA